MRVVLERPSPKGSNLFGGGIWAVTQDCSLGFKIADFESS